MFDNKHSDWKFKKRAGKINKNEFDKENQIIYEFLKTLMQMLLKISTIKKFKIILLKKGKASKEINRVLKDKNMSRFEKLN